MNLQQDVLNDDHIVALYDLENFVQISKKLTSIEVFNLINEIQILTISNLKNYDPLLIKNIGDANLIIFDKMEIDAKIIALHDLKGKIEIFLKSEGFNTKTSFSGHYGEVTIGKLGIKPFESVDAFGESINITFKMNGKPFRNRFTISPQLFRKLNSETRKLFHKFTPQIVYTAD